MCMLLQQHKPQQRLQPGRYTAVVALPRLQAALQYAAGTLEAVRIKQVCCEQQAWLATYTALCSLIQRKTLQLLHVSGPDDCTNGLLRDKGSLLWSCYLQQQRIGCMCVQPATPAFLGTAGHTASDACEI